MATFVETMTTGVTGILSMLGSVTTSLLSNELFAFGLAVLVTSILIGIVSHLVRSGRNS